MTSANRSSEPIAYDDADALERLAGIADAFLVGERPIARRVDDSVAALGPAAGGAAPRARLRAGGGRRCPRSARSLPRRRSQERGDAGRRRPGLREPAHRRSRSLRSLSAFKETIADLCAMYEVDASELLVVHDAHPQYASTQYARSARGEQRAVQHHRAHVASVLAEREALDTTVIGFAFDGTGYGDDGTIWGGEIFTGSVRDGFERAICCAKRSFPAATPPRAIRSRRRPDF